MLLLKRPETGEGGGPERISLEGGPRMLAGTGSGEGARGGGKQRAKGWAEEERKRDKEVQQHLGFWGRGGGSTCGV